MLHSLFIGIYFFQRLIFENLNIFLLLIVDKTGQTKVVRLVCFMIPGSYADITEIATHLKANLFLFGSFDTDNKLVHVVHAHESIHLLGPVLVDDIFENEFQHFFSVEVFLAQ